MRRRDNRGMRRRKRKTTNIEFACCCFRCWCRWSGQDDLNGSEEKQKEKMDDKTRS